MIVQAEGRHPGGLHDGGEMREIKIAAEKRGQVNCKTRSCRKERDPARKRARKEQRGDCASKRDVNGPGDGQGTLKFESVTRVAPEENHASSAFYGFYSGGLVREHEIRLHALVSPVEPFRRRIASMMAVMPPQPEMPKWHFKIDDGWKRHTMGRISLVIRQTTVPVAPRWC